VEEGQAVMIRDRSRCRSALAAVLLVASGVGPLPAQADLMRLGWISRGDGLITADDNGLYWLDLSITRNSSFEYVSAQLATGRLLEGWRYATRAEVEGLWDSAGGIGPYDYFREDFDRPGVFAHLASYLGDTYCMATGCTPGTGFSLAIIDDPVGPDSGFYAARMYDAVENLVAGIPSESCINYYEAIPTDCAHPLVASALVRSDYALPPPSPEGVPEPATVAIVAAGLLGACRRRPRRRVQRERRGARGSRTAKHAANARTAHPSRHGCLRAGSGQSAAPGAHARDPAHLPHHQPRGHRAAHDRPR
jgi:hypothetical protein